jgi:hypothetical protein
MKFSIRDLMLVTVIVALGVAWWVDRSRLASKLVELETETAGLKSQLQSWPQVTLHNPPGMKWQLVPNSSAPAPNPPKNKP